MVDIDVNVVCNSCGKDVEADYLGNEIVVTPCKHCMDENYDLGYDAGVNNIDE